MTVKKLALHPRYDDLYKQIKKRSESVETAARQQQGSGWVNAHEALPSLVAPVAAQAAPTVPSDAVAQAHDRLPFWPDSVRAVPNGVLRSALFSVVARGKRRYMERELVAAMAGVEIRYTGVRLDQKDLDVWSAVLHVARTQSLADECHITGYQLLKLQGLPDQTENYRTLDERLSRLSATAVDVKVRGSSYEGSLIDEVYRFEKSKRSKDYVIKLNPKISSLFSRENFTHLDREVRHELHNQQLAMWLHAFYSTHAQPYPLKIETLLALCGSSAKTLSSFKQKLLSALEVWEKVSNDRGQPVSFRVEDGRVHVERQPSASQMRHLAKKETPRRGPA